MHDPSSEHARLHDDDRLIALARADAQRWQLPRAGDPAANLEHIPARDAFDGYDITDEVHRGAQGVVYRATHLPTGRVVAIKVIRSGPFAGQRDAARFCREIEALQRLDHPNIVAIHASGVAAGCYYFVMDYIAGRALNEHIADHRPPVQARLGLFVDIAEAVHAAHLRGIVHRDLKPSNVRVDGAGRPHVLDFGLARFIADELSAIDGHMTMTGQFVGSLPWASPEQAEGRRDTLDLRTDVYSLGLLLYNMLTGDMPYEVDGPLRMAIDTIVQADPAPPRVAGRRLDEELETIVMKCLRKEPHRRYQTAGELARDVRRHLAGEPIEAKRDSGWYMFKKMIRRHRALAFTSLGMLFAVFMIMVLSLFLWRTAVAQQREAIAAREAAEAARAAEAMQRRLVEVERDRARAAEHRAAEAADRARGEADKAAEVTAFLQDMLASADPQTQPSIRVTVREVLDQAAQQVDTELADRPAVTAEIRETIAQAYETLGLLDNAEAQYRAAVVNRYEAAAAATDASARRELLNELAEVHRHRGQFHKAEELYRRLLAEAGDGESPAVADTLVHLGGVLRAQERRWDAEQALQHALDIYRQSLGEQHPRTAGALEALGHVRLEQHDLDAAEALFNEVLAIRTAAFGTDDLSIAQTQVDLATLFDRRGEFDRAVALYEQALALYSGESAIDRVIDTLAQLALTYRRMGDYDRAEEIYRDILARQEARTTRPTARTALILDSLGWLMIDQQDYDTAQALLERALAMRVEVFGPDHPYTARSLDGLAHLARVRGDLATAENMLCDLRDRYIAWYGAGHALPTRATLALADLLRATGRLEDAGALYHSALQDRAALLGADHVKLSDVRLAYADLLLDLAQTGRALEESTAALDARRSAWGADDWRTSEAAEICGRVLLSRKAAAEAVEVLAPALDSATRHPGPDPALVARLRQRLIEAYDMSGRSADAAALRNPSNGNDPTPE